MLKAAREVYRDRKIICVFQPHRYSRVKALKNEFASSFQSTDAVVLCPIYSAGENKTYNINQDDFAQLISNKSKTQVININDQKKLKIFFRKNLFDDEMIICMGAGSISHWIREIGKELK